MKRVTRCLGCSTVVREQGGHSYKVAMQERTTSMLTGKVSVTDVVGRICRECAQRAGYKVRAVISRS